MTTQDWAGVTRALDEAAEAGQTIGFWLRDDDAVSVTPALERLHRLCTVAGLPVLLAVIPDPAEDALGDWIARTPGFTPCQHGIRHRNHAAAGQRACELGGDRSSEAILAELLQGRQTLQALFGPRLSDILVPPWNRIDPALIPRLPALGFKALSTFGPPPSLAGSIARLNADLDIIDWRNGRTGRTMQDLDGKLVPLIDMARAKGRRIGILTHHLAHDAQAWAVLEHLIERLGGHAAAEFMAVEPLLLAIHVPPMPDLQYDDRYGTVVDSDDNANVADAVSP